MQSPPYLVVVMGLPGSGKTYFARQLATHLSAVHLSSDQVRQDKNLWGKYTLQDKLLVYRQLMSDAEYWIQRQKTVVLDATFHRQIFRDLAEEFAHKQNIALVYLRIVADEATINERVAKKRPDSQADFSVYQQLKQELEPMNRPVLELSSSQQNLEVMIDQATDYINHGLSSV